MDHPDRTRRAVDLPEVLAVLERTPASLDALLRGLPAGWIQAHEGGETWSPYDVIGHLIHGEQTDWLARVRITLEHGEARPFDTFDRLAQFDAAKGRHLDALLDEGGRYEIGQEVLPVDTLKFKDAKKYPDRLKAAMEATGETDAMIVTGGSIMSVPCVVACFEFEFMGGSMGSVVGERFARGAQTAIEQKVPFICITATGGARMQEGLLSLMQMAKTSSALARLSEARLPYISVLTDPTTGGVSASLAMLGDFNLAEPHALIGFAGPRVIEQTVRETLPEGFQRSEFLLAHGAIDMIVDRRDMRARIATLLAMLTRRAPPEVAEPA